MDIREEKDILIERMLDPGAVLTDEELELIMEDAELREILEVSAAVRGAAAQPSAVDVEAEWRLFRHKLHPKPSRWRWAMRVAAIFLGVLVVSAIVRVGIDRLMTADAPAVVAASKPTATTDTSETVTEPPQMPAVEEPMVAVVENGSTPKKRVRKPAVPVLTEEEEQDVEEYLRLQQARIDNELAMMQAELFIDEMQALAPSEPVSECRYMVMP